MKTLYLDLGMGAAGDMLTAALLDLIDDKDEFIDSFNALGIPGVKASYEYTEKCGVTGIKANITVDGEEEGAYLHDHSHEEDGNHHHRRGHHHPLFRHRRGNDEKSNGRDAGTSGEGSNRLLLHEECDEPGNLQSQGDAGHSHSHNGLAEIEHVVREHLDISDKVKEDILSVFNEIAEAEGSVHGKPVDQVHFHEVGTMDAISDVTLVCMLMDKIGPERVVATPVNTGSGYVECAHGILPVPAPATALILEGVPSYSNGIQSELCTPTGAALVKYFVDKYGDMPVMITERHGYGMGKKNFAVCNAVRAVLGEDFGMKDASQGDVDKCGVMSGPSTGSDCTPEDECGDSGCSDDFRPNGEIIELECNIDDMTGEELGFALDRILEAGAADVYYTPIIMKKSRPGVKLSVMVHEENRAAVIKAVFLHTTTIGIRETVMKRYELSRDMKELETEYGKVRCKTSRGYGVTRSKLEYEDLVEIAEREGRSLREIREECTCNK